jgi:protoheme ferro-lyase
MHPFRQAFMASGSNHLQLVESLNGSPLFIELLKDLATD